MSKLIQASMVVGLVAGLMGMAADSFAQPDEKLPTAAELFPLKKGAVWTYEPVEKEYKDWGYKASVVDTEVKDGVLYYKINKVPHSPQAQAVPLYYAHKADGLYYAGEHDYHFVQFNPPVCILKNANQQVQSWKASTKSGRVGGGLGGTQSETENQQEHSVTQYSETIDLDGKEVPAIVSHHTWHMTGFWTLKENGKVLANPRFFAQRLDAFVTVAWFVKDRGIVKIVKYNLDANGQKTNTAEITWALRSVTGLGGRTISDIQVNKADVESDSPVVVDSYRLEPGDSAKFKFSRTITRDVTLSVKASTEAEITAAKKLNLPLVQAEVSGKIKTAVEAAAGTKYEVSEMREREITITNTSNKVREGKIVWIDTYRTGTFKVTQDEKEYELQFRFPTGTRLESRNKE